MKIVELKTHVGVSVGDVKSVDFMGLKTPGLGIIRGLALSAFVHPELGAGVVIESDKLKEKGKVTFCPINNVEYISFAPEEPAPAKGKK